MEITNFVRIKALGWFKNLTHEKRYELFFKHYKKLTGFTSDEIVIIWRRETGGEWSNDKTTYIYEIIAKYEKGLLQQIELKKQTPLSQCFQHQLLDQNIAFFNEMIEDLKKLI